jgi:hypothetical protein
MLVLLIARLVRLIGAEGMVTTSIGTEVMAMLLMGAQVMVIMQRWP